MTVQTPNLGLFETKGITVKYMYVFKSKTTVTVCRKLLHILKSFFIQRPEQNTESKRNATLKHSKNFNVFLFCTFFGGLECVGHNYAYVARFVFLRDVWIRTHIKRAK